MRYDKDLANANTGIDFILGGHDHEYEEAWENDMLILKSGTDFQQLSVVTVTVPDDASKKPEVEVKRIDITPAIPENKEMKELVDRVMSEVNGIFCLKFLFHHLFLFPFYFSNFYFHVTF